MSPKRSTSAIPSNSEEVPTPNEAPVAKRQTSRVEEHRSSSRNSSKMDSSRAAWYRLKRSQQIALLVLILRYMPEGTLTEGGRERLAYLQEISSIEAISRGFDLALRAISDRRLRGTLAKAEAFAQSPFHLSRSAKKRRKNRIRGYRDKGTLSSISHLARRQADADAFIKVGHFKDDRADSLIGLIEFLSGMLDVDIYVGGTISLERVQKLGEKLTPELARILGNAN